MALDPALQTRIRSALVFAVIVLGALYVGCIAFTLLTAVALVIGIYEWVRMLAHEKKYRILFLIAGSAYIGLALGMMAWLRNATEHGLYNMLTLLLIVWASDISAYFTGKTIGGPKLAPAISPKKTWSGFWGSSVGAGLAAAALACPCLLDKFGVETIGGMSWMAYGAMGFVLAMFGQAGDLIESAFKRRYGVKDSGTIMPGHGGILDRIDALMLVSIVFGAIAMYFR